LNRNFSAVVNDDTDHEQTLMVSLLNQQDLRDLRTGTVLKPAPDNTAAVKLRPGDGIVLEKIR
jgi:hypothetical protein